ncbi:MAG: hypothetical protein NVSMB23_13290 [Myxococcales bacterium]
MRNSLRLASVASALALTALPALAVEMCYPQADLHGFPSMSDEGGKVIADGELTQTRKGDRLMVHAVWRFKDGRIAEEDDVLRTRPELSQESFRWVERRGKQELRRAEVDFQSGKATFSHREDGKPKSWEAKLDLPKGQAFTGYSTALAASQLRDALGQQDARRSLTFVAFTPKPRTVELEIARAAGAHIRAAGRELPADLYTLHPKIPFPLSVVAHAPDSHLWFTHSSPPALLRAEQNLLEKDDPRIRIDVIPSGAARPQPAARRGKLPR